MTSMAIQRSVELGRRAAVIGDRLAELHPDSPEAQLLHEELQKIFDEHVKLRPIIEAETPWWVKYFFLMCEWLGILLRPVFGLWRYCHRAYHMLRGLM